MEHIFPGNDFVTIKIFDQNRLLTIFGRTHVIEEVILHPLKISSKDFEKFLKDLEKIFHH